MCIRDSVNIVVGSMRAEDLSRYADNYGEGGLRRLIDGGTVFADSRYDYQQTTTPVSLATLSTGAMLSLIHICSLCGADSGGLERTWAPVFLLEMYLRDF